MTLQKNLVFVVEDNLTQQKMLQVHFEQMGNYEVRTFADPKAMLPHLDEKPFAVVLDHFFEDKEKTGLDYLKVLRKSHRQVPVIYHTTLDDQQVREKALELGAVEYIVKDSASLVRLRTALDNLQKKKNQKGFFGRLFGK